jgi:hypothetical protein
MREATASRVSAVMGDTLEGWLDSSRQARLLEAALARISHTTFPLVINGRKSCLQFFRV